MAQFKINLNNTEACTILGDGSRRNRNKKRAPDLARALRFSRRRHSWMTGTKT